MALEKYLKELSGEIAEKAPAQTGGGGSEEQIIATGTDGLIDPSLLPPGAGPDLIIIEAFEILAAGDFVNIFDDAGTPKVRKAIAETGKDADGFVLLGVAAAASASVFLEGRNTALSALTIGAKYWLSDAAAGTVVATAPSASAKKVQLLGKAYLSTAMTTENLSGVTILKA